MALAININMRGIRADQPAAGPENEGCFYTVTDEGDLLEQSDGATWNAVAAGTGTVTNTGTLTAGKLLEGNGTVDLKVNALTAPVTKLTAGVPSAATDGTDYVSPLTQTVVQVVNTQTGAVATGTTVIPVDDSIPQKTEGDEYMTLAITPTNAANKLKIEVVVHASHSTLTAWEVAALFQDTTADALAVGATFSTTATAFNGLSFTHYMTAGTTSATTFKVRVGSNAVGTTTFNGQGGARRFGGRLVSSITITEIVP